MRIKVRFIDRTTGETLEEKVYFEQLLCFLYGSWLGQLLVQPVARLSIFSRFFGWFQRLASSKKKILPFVETYKINTSEFELPLEAYPTFDAFFTRKLKKEMRPLGPGAVMPADGRYLFYQDISSCDGFLVKGKTFSLEKLVGDVSLAQHYAQGSMAIIRLAPVDYHRFHFPIDCRAGPCRLINGPLFSVHPIAIRKNINLLTQNKRMLTELYSQDYGTVLFIEIGATNVGSIHQSYQAGQAYKKGDEKGYFSFGGSSIILLFEKKSIQFACDLVANSKKYLETFCRFGQSMEENPLF